MAQDSDSPAPQPKPIRASDAERDTVAGRLRDAFAEGRLDPDEYQERLETLYNAKTQGELVPLTEDLPAPSEGSAPVPRAGGTPRPVYGAERVVDAEPTSTMAMAVMSGVERSGDWVVPRQFTAVSLMGYVEIDLREARFAAREVTIYAHTVMGATCVIVPEDVVVRVNGAGVMGGYWLDNDPSSVTSPDAPVVTITGVALMGAVWAEYQPRKHQKSKKRGVTGQDGSTKELED